MRLIKHHMWLALVAVIAASPSANAQFISPHIGYVYPAGARQGATLRVTIGGQYLTGITNVHVTGSGIQAHVVEVIKPMTTMEAQNMRDKIQELARRRGTGGNRGFGMFGDFGPVKTNANWTAADEKTYQSMLKKAQDFVPPTQLIPALSDSVILEVKLAANAEPGEREIRIGNSFGISNPMRFHVGQLPEYSQPLSKIIWDRQNSAPDMRPIAAKREMTIGLPATVNGQIMPGGMDQYTFRGHKGQSLVIVTSARQLLPYLPDAVPGWFQAAVTLYDIHGKELAYDDDFHFHPDPVLFYQIPDDGLYTVEIRDSVYRGRQDFVYRLSIGDLPFVTGIYPLGGPVGKETKVELKGWNLPVTNLSVTPKAAGTTYLSVKQGELISNLVPFAADNLPEFAEQEPNDLPGSAQRLTLPAIVNGRINIPNDTDVYSFEGRAGEQIVAEVYARRLDSPVDAVLRLTDANGTQLAYNDDHEDKATGLNTHHADSYLSYTLPASGTYYLRLTDAQKKGGPEYAYRMRVSAPRPDFALRVVPASVSARSGASVPITVYALRKDGFTNAIIVMLKDAPPGFALAGAQIPAGEEMVRFTLTTPPITTKDPIKLTFLGRAIFNGEALTHEAVPAEDMMQAFAYRHLVTAAETDVAIFGSRFGSRTPVKIYSQTPLQIPAGGTARIELGMPMSSYMGSIELELSDPPDGIAIEKVSSSRDGTAIVLHSDASKVKPGQKGNLILNSFFAGRPGDTSGKAKKVDKRFTSLGALPAIPFEVVAK